MYTVPRAFRGYFGEIQRKALKSWTFLEPKCEIILIGNEEGTAAVAKEVGALHLPDVKCNSYGTPLVSDAMALAEKAAGNELLCFISTDDILMSDFTAAVAKVKNIKDKFILCGARWEGIDSPEGFPEGWEGAFKSHVKANGRLSGPSAIDYIIFPKGFFGTVPPFAIGRSRYDNWWIYRARSLGRPVIDITNAVTVVHQNHDHIGIVGGKAETWEKTPEKVNTWEGPEAEVNKELYGKNRSCYTLNDANYILTVKGLRRSITMEALKHDLSRLIGKN